MIYNCSPCNYSTDRQSNYCHHKKSLKHIAKINEKSNTVVDSSLNVAFCSQIVATMLQESYCNPTIPELPSKNICKKCNSNFKHTSSLYRHQKKCEIIPSADNFTERELKLKLEFSEKEKELYQKLEKEKSELLKEKSDLLNNFMNNANVLLNKANDNTKITAQAMHSVSVSALKYANDKFKDTPALLPLNNFNINNLDFNNVTDKEQLIETLIYCAKQKSVDKLLGDHIVKCYKKENPEEQSFHTTDCSRLNYIVRDLIENALTWAVDKSGLKICKEIVKPLIKKCIDILLEHQKTLLKEMSNGNYEKQKDVELIIDVIMSIDSGELETEINKYIAPYFNLKR